MDIEAIKAAKSFEESQTICLELRKKLLEQEKIIAKKEEQYSRLLEQLKLALHRQYNKQSEKLSTEQLNLFDEPKVSDAEKSALEEADESITIPAHTRRKKGRKPLPKHLPREEIIHDLPEEEKICSCCDNRLQVIGEDRSEQLEYVPAKLKVIVHVRKKYACKSCQDNVKMAALPKFPIPKSIATVSLLTQIIISKYQDHLPLYRQEQIFNRLGIDMPRNTTCLWMIKCATLFEPLIDLMRKQICSSNYVNVDETPVRVLEQKSKGYMFVYVGGCRDHPMILYDYQPTRSGQSAEDFLKNFEGYLQSDAFSGYDRFEQSEEIDLVGCWAHVRRKFFDITKITKTAGSAHEALKMIQRLYQVEQEAKNLTREERFKLREEKSKPILEQIKVWLEKRLPQVLPKSALSAAIGYALNQWPRLMGYLKDGQLAIGRVENWRAASKIAFPVPAHQTGRALLTHPAFVQSHTFALGTSARTSAIL